MPFLTPQAHGEAAVLTTYALQQLAQVRTTLLGLTDDEANTASSASMLTLTALAHHCGAVGVFWSACAAAAPNPPELPDDLQDEPLDDLVAKRATVAETLAFLDRCLEVTRANLAGVTDLSARVPTPDAPWIPAEVTHWEARWVLLHICTEVARHAGHADIIRESVDGKGSYELNDLADAEAGRS